MLNVCLSFPESSTASTAVADGLKVRRYDLCEALSEHFELTIEVLSTDPAMQESAIVGHAVTIDFGDEPFLKQIRGIVRQVAQRTAVPTGDSLYVWVVVPAVWL